MGALAPGWGGASSDSSGLLWIVQTGLSPGNAMSEGSGLARSVMEAPRRMQAGPWSSGLDPSTMILLTPTDVNFTLTRPSASHVPPSYSTRALHVIRQYPAGALAVSVAVEASGSCTFHFFFFRYPARPAAGQQSAVHSWPN